MHGLWNNEKVNLACVHCMKPFQNFHTAPKHIHSCPYWKHKKRQEKILKDGGELMPLQETEYSDNGSLIRKDSDSTDSDSSESTDSEEESLNDSPTKPPAKSKRASKAKAPPKAKSAKRKSSESPALSLTASNPR